MEIEIFQIDAFSSELFKGNPACVMPLESWLPDELLLNIAKENNVSETAFFVKKNNGFILRWFTPEIEMDLCGHATLAAAYVIINYFKHKISSEKVMATQNNIEPMAFSFTEMGTCMSDSYSYWDQTSDELSAKGQGGLRQMHSFVTLNHDDKIYTPEDDYEPDKVGEVDLGKLQAQREKDIKAPPQSSLA